MPRYSAQQREDLHFNYIAAAIDLATQQGWAAVRIRSVGDAVGKSAMAIQRKGIVALKLELVRAAFGELDRALVFFLEMRPRPRRSEIYPAIVQHLRVNPEAASLMLRVSAQAGLSGSEEADAISDCFARKRAESVKKCAAFFQSIDPDAASPNHWSSGRHLLRWYIAVCVTLVTEADVRDATLLAMARP